VPDRDRLHPVRAYYDARGESECTRAFRLPKPGGLSSAAPVDYQSGVSPAR
jgi:hypothetical protein